MEIRKSLANVGPALLRVHRDSEDMSRASCLVHQYAEDVPQRADMRKETEKTSSNVRMDLEDVRQRLRLASGLGRRVTDAIGRECGSRVRRRRHRRRAM